MKLVYAYLRASTVELARYPAFSLPTLLFPATLYLVFGVAGAAEIRLAGFAGIAVLGVAFFQFGVGIAVERSSPWERYLRTLPARAGTRIAGRVASAGVFALCSAAAVIIAAVASADLQLSPRRWGLLAAVLLGGAVPFALLGIALGYLVPPRAALPVANLVYLPLAYVGGLWTGPQSAPGGAATLAPTHQWAQLLWDAAGRGTVRISAVGQLAGWAVAFACLALWGYRRDEGERFR